LRKNTPSLKVRRSEDLQRSEKNGEEKLVMGPRAKAQKGEKATKKGREKT